MTSMTKDEALKLALEALEKSTKYFNIVRLGESRLKDTEIRGASHKAITAIKEALAQPDAFEQGPQEGKKQERALWELTKLGQEIEAQLEQEPVFECKTCGKLMQMPADDCLACERAQPAQEPVAKYSDIVSDGGLDPRNKFDLPAQRPWAGLTDADTHAIWNKDFRGWISRDSMEQIKQAIEAKLKEKNT